MQAPLWLRDAPDVRALLEAVIDRFDKQSGDSRARNIVLGPERLLPSLGRNDADADQTWELIRELERLHVLTIHAGRRSPYDSPWVAAKLKFAPASESLLRVWMNRPAEPSVWQQWRAAVLPHAHAFADRGAALHSRRIVIAGRTNDEVVAALASLADVRHSATLRQLSAFAFWGDSKVLDDRAELIATLFPQLVVRERKIIVALHVPQDLRGVLFIENQDTYTAAIEGSPASSRHHALVYLAGFRGAATRIRNAEGAVLHFSGAGAARYDPELQSWWFSERSSQWPLAFWGDLDFAGMQILKTLRSRFPEVCAWQPGYEAMVQALQLSGSHARDNESGQIDPQLTGCDYADHVLLPQIRALGFRDQESIAA